MMIVQMCHFMIVHFIGIYSLCSVCVCACVRACIRARGETIWANAALRIVFEYIAILQYLIGFW